MVVVDLKVGSAQKHMTVRTAAVWSAIWVGLAIAFGAGLWAFAGGEEYVAAVNVGVRPTFKTGRGLLVEAFLVDFEGDLYGAPLRLDFLERLRGERRFDSIDALVDQMGRDVVETRRIAA